MLYPLVQGCETKDNKVVNLSLQVIQRLITAKVTLINTFLVDIYILLYKVCRMSEGLVETKQPLTDMVLLNSFLEVLKTFCLFCSELSLKQGAC